jgi:hypothetical protein
MTVQVRTRHDKATITTLCTDGAEHRFTINIDGTITNSHHLEGEDDVIVALGGEPTMCGKAVIAYEAARDVHRAQLGVADVPNLTWNRRRGWVIKNDHICTGARCPGAHHDLAHVMKMRTQLHVRNLNGADFDRAGGTFLRWLNRVVSPATVYAKKADLIDAEGLSVPRRDRFYLGNTIAYMVLTPEFVRLSKAVVGMNLSYNVSLRTRGVTVQWLRTLVENLDARTLRKIRRHDEKMVAALSAARNVDPRAVAALLSAGVYSHLHTYVRAHARPDQVLAVYRATNGQTTLADLLDEGLTVHQAIQRVSA